MRDTQKAIIVFICLCLNIFVQTQTFTPIVLVHGGAGDISDDAVPLKKEGVKIAARIGYETLLSTNNVLDAVQEAVQSLELNKEFNAGHGSVLTWDGKVEMDAAIMDGRDLNAGCVSIVRDIYHPVQLARRVLEQTRHMYLAGEGAMKFAIEDGFEILPEGSLVTNNSLKALEDYKNSLSLTKFSNLSDGLPEQKVFGSPGTVGAVAIDAFGNVAAATSTGGITGKLPGRIGDSPILGGGTYADNAMGTISATGNGETIMRYNVASRILALISHEGMSAQAATTKVLHDMSARFPNQTAGVISIDAKGTVGISFTSRRMSWAYQRGDELHFGVDAGEDKVEIVGEPRFDFY